MSTTATQNQSVSCSEVRFAEVEHQLAAALQLGEYYRQQLYGKMSERYDPAQEHLDFGENVLGKPEAAANSPEDESAEDESAKCKSPQAPRKRRSKDLLFPRWIKSVLLDELIPDELKANPEAFRQIEIPEHRELETIRAEAYWRVTPIPKFVRNDDPQAPPISCPAPAPTVPRTLCGPQLISQIICGNRAERQRRAPKKSDRRGTSNTATTFRSIARWLFIPLFTMNKRGFEWSRWSELNRRPIHYE